MVPPNQSKSPMPLVSPNNESYQIQKIQRTIAFDNPRIQLPPGPISRITSAHSADVTANKRHQTEIESAHASPCVLRRHHLAKVLCVNHQQVLYGQLQKAVRMSSDLLEISTQTMMGFSQWPWNPNFFLLPQHKHRLLQKLMLFPLA